MTTVQNCPNCGHCLQTEESQFSNGLRARREALGWSRTRAVVEMRRVAHDLQMPPLPSSETLEKAVARHERGEVRPSAFYLKIYRAMYALQASSISRGHLSLVSYTGDSPVAELVP